MVPKIDSAGTRRKLLTAASELFYAEGITAASVDRIVARSGLSKPTLYHHFPSKMQLVNAVLEARHEQRRSTLEPDLRARAASPRDQLLAVFDWLADWLRTDGARGCAFVNAAVEIVDPTEPAREVARRHKRWMRDVLRRFAAAADVDDPDGLAASLMLLVEGATATALIEESPAAALEAKRAAAHLIAAHARRTPSGKAPRDPAAQRGGSVA